MRFSKYGLEAPPELTRLPDHRVDNKALQPSVMRLAGPSLGQVEGGWPGQRVPGHPVGSVGRASPA